MRPALGFVVMGLAFGGIYLATKWQGEGENGSSLTIAPVGDRLRGTVGAPSDAGSPVLLPASRTDTGTTVLRWRRVPGADSYTVTVQTPGYVALATLGPLADTVTTVPPVTWPQGERASDHVFWQVMAMREGQVIATSAIGDAPRP
jgi:hypothetical protein